MPVITLCCTNPFYRIKQSELYKTGSLAQLPVIRLTSAQTTPFTFHSLTPKNTNYSYFSGKTAPRELHFDKNGFFSLFPRQPWHYNNVQQGDVFSAKGLMLTRKNNRPIKIHADTKAWRAKKVHQRTTEVSPSQQSGPCHTR